MVESLCVIFQEKNWKYSEIKILFDIWNLCGCDKCLLKAKKQQRMIWFHITCVSFYEPPSWHTGSGCRRGSFNLLFLPIPPYYVCSVFACLIRQETLKPMVYLWFKRYWTLLLQPLPSNLIHYFIKNGFPRPILLSACILANLLYC